MKTILFLCVCSLYTSHIWGQKVLQLKPGPADSKDAYIQNLNVNQIQPNKDVIMGLWGTSSGTPFIGRSLFDFDLSTIPLGASVDSVKLSLYGNVSGSGPLHTWTAGPNTSLLQRITSSWSDTSVTWSTMPTVTTLNQVTLATSTSSSQHYLDIDVTDLVNDMLQNPTSSFGFMIRMVTESGYRGMVFSSSDEPDSLYWPELNIYYTCAEVYPVSVGYCPNDSVSINGVYYKEPTIINDTITTSTLCDSIYEYHIEEKDVDTGFVVAVSNQLLFAGNSQVVNWYDCNSGLPILTAIGSVYTPPGAGSFAVVYSDEGCIDTTDCIDFIVTGTNELSENSRWNVFPNPVNNGEMTIMWEDLDVTEIRIHNNSGQLILSENVFGKSHQKRLEISGPNGVYLVSIQTTVGIIYKKIIVK